MGFLHRWFERANVDPIAVDRFNPSLILSTIRAHQRASRAEQRHFGDIWPYLGHTMLTNAVEKVIIQPMLGGARRIVPQIVVAKYQDLSQKFAENKFYQVLSPLPTAISSYVNEKIESGVFWGIKKGFKVLVDNFIEF